MTANRSRSFASHRFASPTVLAAVLLASPCAPAVAGDPLAWRLDPVHTRVMFAVSHAGFSNAIGTISGSEGTLLFDPEDLSSARLEVSVPLDRLDLGDDAWNRAALGSRLLDAVDHPRAEFRSSTVQPHDDSSATLCGELTLRGISAPLCLEVKVNDVRRHPMPPFRRTAGFSAAGVLSRSDHGVDGWGSMIGDEVELRIEAEAVRSRGAAAAFEPDASEPGAPEAGAPEADVPTAEQPTDVESGMRSDEPTPPEATPDP